MCGLAGIFLPGGSSAERLQTEVAHMAQTLVHRGPDDSGAWCDAATGIGLAFRRLAILDLSPTGHQPMVSRDGRFVLTFNGEIYNHVELRQRLSAEGVRFRGTSDTEVVVEAMARWGVQSALEELSGMFAIAAWDAQARRLVLARDRLGKKPLYLARVGRGWAFASELKAICALAEFPRRIDLVALTAYLRFGYVPGNACIFEDVEKVPAGAWMEASTERPWSMHAFWTPHTMIAEAVSRRRPWSDSDAVDELERRLADAVTRRMIADVPVGAFLSGGIDSSAVVAIMQSHGAGRVRTYSIGFENPAYDEAQSARAVANHLGTEHTEFYVSARDALDVVPRLPSLFDEPLADASQIPTYLMARLARREVTVVLTGDGGDEAFGGYTRHLWMGRFLSRLNRIPSWARRVAGRGLASTPMRFVAGRHALVSHLLPMRWRVRQLSDKIARLQEAMEANNGLDLYLRLVSRFQSPRELVRGQPDDAPLIEAAARCSLDLADQADCAMALDLMLYLTGDILVKVDRATMAASLEARSPLLDHRIVEWAWALPLNLKIRDGQGKWLLRQVLYRHVPRAMVDRPKAGFTPPIGEWLRGPLREWAEDLLGQQGIAGGPVLETAGIHRLWQAHQTGALDEHRRLWTVLTFLDWQRYWRATVA
jgi:asparagine synthase (glutamine-hydrolysing)